MINKLYDEILRMILKRTQNVSGDVYTNINYTNFIPTLSPDDNNPDPSQDPDVFDVISQESYNYKLEYNDEEELIGFTSNNGDWHWILNNDSYGDLVSILVTNPYYNFLIAMIWINYDVRRNDAETDEKGLLSEVVLLNPDGTSLFKGLSIEPKFLSISPTETAKFDAYLELPNGEKVLASDLVEWNIYNPEGDISIDSNGLVSNASTGNWTISAFYNGKEYTATLEVRKIDLKISPDRSTINPGSTITYKVTDVSTIPNNVINNTDCEWNIVCNDTSIPLPTIDNGVLNNVGNYDATYIIICSYKGNSIQASVKVVPPQLFIDPSKIEIYAGQTAQFNAFLKRASEYNTVNRQCNWIIDNNEMQINDGFVSNTNIVGTFNIGATYDILGVSSTAILVVKNSKLALEPAEQSLDTNSNFQFHAYYTDDKGNKKLVDTQCMWSIDSPCAINNGKVITSNEEGEFVVTVVYNEITIYGKVTVINPYIEIRPSLQEVEIGQSCSFRAYFINSKGEQDVTDVGIWQVNSTDALIYNGTFFNCNISGNYTVGITYVLDKKVYKAESVVVVKDSVVTLVYDNKEYYLGDSINISAILNNTDISVDCKWYLNDSLITNFTGTITPITSGPNTISVVYKNKEFSKSINITERELVVLPESSSVVVDKYESFKAYLRSDGNADIDVTTNCIWTVDPPLKISLSGKVTNTVDTGNFTVRANYKNLSSMEDTALLVVSDKSYNVHTKKMIFSFRDSDTIDGDYITVWLNDNVILDNIRLELAWTSVEVELQDGVNILKVGANCNGLDLYNNPTYGPSYSAGKVTTSFKAVSLDNVSVITETIFNINVPETGASRIDLDPTQYYELCAINFT